MSLRESPLGEFKVPLTWTAGIALALALAAGAAFLISDKRAALRAETYGAARTLP